MDFRAVITQYRDHLENEYNAKRTVTDEIEAAMTKAASLESGDGRAAPAAAIRPAVESQPAAAEQKPRATRNRPAQPPPAVTVEPAAPAEAAAVPAAAPTAPRAAAPAAATTAPPKPAARLVKPRKKRQALPPADLEAAEPVHDAGASPPPAKRSTGSDIPSAETVDAAGSPAKRGLVQTQGDEDEPVPGTPGGKPTKRTRDRQIAREARKAEIRTMMKAGGPKSLAEIIDPRVAEILVSRGSITSSEILRVLGEPSLSPVMAAWSRKSEALGVKFSKLLIRSKTEAGEGVYQVTIEGLDASGCQAGRPRPLRRPAKPRSEKSGRGTFGHQGDDPNMSRSKEDRARNRVAQIHYCAICYESGNYVKRQTWMFEIPPESDTYAMLGRIRTWFCKSCLAAILESDTVFAAKNQHLELLEPAWWNEPGSPAQHEYVQILLANRVVEPTLLKTIEDGLETAGKGQMSCWLEELRDSHYVPREPEAASKIDAGPPTKARASSETIH